MSRAFRASGLPDGFDERHSLIPLLGGSCMDDASLTTVTDHWATILDCDPAVVFAPGVSVVSGDTEAVEILGHSSGATLSAPPSLADELRSVVTDRSVALTATGARELVESATESTSGEWSVDEVLGPQFVGYCDDSTFSSVHDESSPVGLIEPESLSSLREATPAEEWDRSGVRIDDEPTFAVERDGDRSRRHSIRSRTAPPESKSSPIPSIAARETRRWRSRWPRHTRWTLGWCRSTGHWRSGRRR
jgi:hypothetical protein